MQINSQMYVNDSFLSIIKVTIINFGIFRRTAPSVLPTTPLFLSL